MSNKSMVVAIFNDEVSADAAAASLKDSGVAKGDAIGVLVLNEKGELKADKVGKRSWGKGPASARSWPCAPRSGWPPA